MCTSIPTPASGTPANRAEKSQPQLANDEASRTVLRRPQTASSLVQADRTFRALAKDNDKLAIDGRLLGHGLPARMINLLELKKLLLKASTSFEARDVVWRHLVRQARTGDPAWILAAVGVAIPALTRRAADLAAGYGRSTVDIDSELLVGFLDALRRIDIDAPRVITRLISPAGSDARRYRDGELKARGVDGARRYDSPAIHPDNHPDIALDRAVAAGLISDTERDVISATSIGGQSLTEYADEKGRTYEWARMCRYRGIQRLKQAHEAGLLRSGDQDDADVIREATMTVAWPADED